MENVETQIIRMLKELEESADGTVAIEGGKVIINPPKGKGRFPVIRPGNNTKVIVNGREITGDTVIVPSDVIEIQAINEENQETPIKVEVSQDEMKAYVTIDPPLRRVYCIKDMPPSPKLEVEVEEEYIYMKPPDLSRVSEALCNAGVVEGIIWENVLDALQKCNGEKTLVAVGMSAIDGEKGYLDLVYKQKKNRKVVLTKDRVDYRERDIFESVEAGEIVAVIVPPSQGKDGITVTGKVIKAKEGRPFQVTCGKGVKQVNEKIIAEKGGRPCVYGNHIEIVPTLVVEGDVDLSTGNIHFQGDVLVTGDVRSGMMVEASGMVKVLGIVEQAEIVARDGIIAANYVIGSKIRAGLSVDQIASILPIARELLTELGKLYDAYCLLSDYIKTDYIKKRAIENQDNFKMPMVFKVLLEKKYDYIPKLARKLRQICSEKREALNSEEVSYFCSLADLICKPINFEEKEFHERFTDLTNWLKEWVELAEKSNSRTSDIKLSYAQSSELYATGNIRVEGKGCINTVLVAGNEVSVTGDPGVFRGGKIIAGGNVYIEEIGSPGIVYSQVVIPANKRAVFGKIAGPCLVKIGSDYVRFEMPHERVTIFMDEEGRVKVR